MLKGEGQNVAAEARAEAMDPLMIWIVVILIILILWVIYRALGGGGTVPAGGSGGGRVERLIVAVAGPAAAGAIRAAAAAPGRRRIGRLVDGAATADGGRTAAGQVGDRKSREVTAGEIIVVVTLACGEYLRVPLVWAALVALSTVPLYCGPRTGRGDTALQLFVFVVLSFVLSIRFLLLRGHARALKRQHAHRTAVEQFLARELHTTRGRTGVLIFVALAESATARSSPTRASRKKSSRRFWTTWQPP